VCIAYYVSNFMHENTILDSCKCNVVMFCCKICRKDWGHRG